MHTNNTRFKIFLKTDNSEVLKNISFDNFRISTPKGYWHGLVEEAENNTAMNWLNFYVQQQIGYLTLSLSSSKLIFSLVSRT